MWSTRAVEARPVRTFTSVWRRASMLLAMRVWASLWISLIIAAPGLFLSPASISMPVRRRIVQVVAARAELHLQGRVVDAEALVQFVVDAVEERVVAVAAGADQMRGHRNLAGTQRPDVKVVDGRNAFLRQQPVAHQRLFQARRHRIHCGVE